MARKLLHYTEQDILDYINKHNVSRHTAMSRIRYAQLNPPGTRKVLVERSIDITDEEITSLMSELSITYKAARTKLYQRKVHKLRREAKPPKPVKVKEVKPPKEDGRLKRVSIWYTYEEITAYMAEHNVSRETARNRIKTKKKCDMLPPKVSLPKVVKEKVKPEYKVKNPTGSKYATEAEIAQYQFETGKSRHDAMRYWRLVKTNRPIKEARALLVKMGFTEEDSFIVITQKIDGGEHHQPVIPYGVEYWFKNPTTLLWDIVMLDNSHLDKIFPLNK